MASGIELATAYVSLSVEASKIAPETAKQFGAVEKQASASGKKASSNFGSGFKAGIGTVIKAGALWLAAAAAGGIAFARSSIAEARESQKVGALTAQVIKSTGGAAKISAAQVGDLATAISNKTGIDDEAIQSGANMLLTFKNIRNEAGKGNDIFNQSTSILTDLATAMGSDPQKAAIQLGKALNDPIKGVAALGRVGVTFTAGQKKTIKSLVDGGKTAEAQKIILKELSSEFGGAAEASATAGEKMSTAFGNFKEGIATSLLPAIDKAEGFITTKLLPGIQGVIDILFKGDFTSGFARAFNISEDSKIVDFLFNVREGAQQLFNILFKGDFTGGPLSEDSGMVDALFTLREGLGSAKDALVGFVGEYKNGTGAGGLFRDVVEKIGSVVLATGKFLLDHKKVVVGVVAAWVAFRLAAIAYNVVQLVSLALLKAHTVGTLENTVVTKAAAVASKVFAAGQWLVNAALTANPIGIVIALIVLLVAGLILAYKKSDTFRAVVKGAFEAIGTAARFMWNNVVAPVIRFLIGAFVKVTEFYAALLRGLSKIPGFGWAKGAADKLQDVADKANSIKDAIHDIPDKKKVDVSVNFRPTSGRIKVGNEFVNVGKRAGGGPVTAGSPYIVGEHEPELFVPETSGTILNQSQIARAGGSGGDTFNVYANDPLAAASAVHRRQVFERNSR